MSSAATARPGPDAVARRRGPQGGPKGGPRVGLLGGSFNPAHGGHLAISELALRRLRLDAVWWLVSPQNPLKPRSGMATLADRLAGARDVAGNRRIHVTDLERRLGTRYTTDTLAALSKWFPRHRFVWLMGADNLIEIPAWRHWTRIFETLPVAVFNRPYYGYRAVSSRAAHRFSRARVTDRQIGQLADMPAPSWGFVWNVFNLASATEIRCRPKS